MTDKELKAKVVEAKAMVIADGRPANADNIVSYFFSRIPGARESGATREQVLAVMKPGKKFEFSSDGMDIEESVETVKAFLKPKPKKKSK